MSVRHTENKKDRPKVVETLAVFSIKHKVKLMLQDTLNQNFQTVNPQIAKSIATYNGYKKKAESGRFSVSKSGKLYDKLSAAKCSIGVKQLVRHANNLHRWVMRQDEKLRELRAQNESLQQEIEELKVALVNTNADKHPADLWPIDEGFEMEMELMAYEALDIPELPFVQADYIS